ncbi:MAG: ClbS/DfsB family four-helix bundle protein [Saprospiraceae bacterium]
MPRPKSKSELLRLSQENYEKLLSLIDSYSDEEVIQDFREGAMNRNIRDVLAHLYHWHTMLKIWYTIGMKGEKPDMPAKGYKWNNLLALNKKIWEMYQDVPLEQAKELLHQSHTEVQGIIHKHSNEELFEKKRYKWTGSTSMGEYLISNSSSHYAWAIKLIKRGMK